MWDLCHRWIQPTPEEILPLLKGIVVVFHSVIDPQV
jgi:hypothetical protein